MNTATLTGVKRSIFILVGQQPGITREDLCSYSICRGGQLSRINHHLKGLEDRGFIFSLLKGKKRKHHYIIAKGKGKRMFESLQD